MYIEHPKQKNQHQNSDYLYNPRQNKEILIEAPDEKMLPEHSSDVLAHWKAPEFEAFRGDSRWYTYMALILLAIIGYAVYTNSPIMAITFILIGVSGYIHINREPKILDFMVTPDGIVAGTDLFEFDNIHSFWIFYEPDDIRVISLHTKSHLLPFVHIPIHEENPVQIRELLLNFIPEEKHKQGPVEMFERMLRI